MRLALWSAPVRRQQLLASAIFCAAFVVAAQGTAQGGTLKTLYSFCAQTDCLDGNWPNGSLIQDSKGNLFGTTSIGGGGPYQPGTAFELARSKSGEWKFKVLYRFCSQPVCADGDGPEPLVIDTAGNLYGATTSGGTNNTGTVFELSRGASGQNWTITTLYNFPSSGLPGSNPCGPLTYAGARSGIPYDGTSPLFGVTCSGGANNLGAVYEATPGGGTWTISNLYSFRGGGSDGQFPVSGLTLDSRGNLFGMVLVGGSSGAGGIFQLSSGGANWTETLLYSFTRATGEGPSGTLLLSPSGSILGTNGFGGPYCHFKRHSYRRCGGVVFELKPDGADWEYSLKYAFCSVAVQRACLDGAYPYSGVIADTAGNLLGTTIGGGPHARGVLFRIGTDGSYTDLYDFCGQHCADGKKPEGSLYLDSKTGKFYGVTREGGANKGGTVFEFSP